MKNTVDSKTESIRLRRKNLKKEQVESSLQKLVPLMFGLDFSRLKNSHQAKRISNYKSLLLAELGN